MNFLLMSLVCLCAVFGLVHAGYAVVRVRSKDGSWSSKYCASYNDSWSKQPPANIVAASYHDLVIVSSCSLSLEVHSSQAAVLVIQRKDCQTISTALYNKMTMVLVADAETDVLPNLLHCSGATDDLHIPLMIVSGGTGREISEQRAALEMMAYSAHDSTAPVNGAEVLLMLMSLTCIFVSAIYVTRPWNFLRNCITEPMVNNDTRRLFSLINSSWKMVSIAVAMAGLCVVVVLLYFFYYPLVYLVLLLYSANIYCSLCFHLSPLMTLLPFCKHRLNMTIQKHKLDMRHFLTVAVSLTLTLWWLMERNKSYIWILHNILGILFISYVICGLSYVDMWMILSFLILLLFYDIFFVFLTPLLFNGNNMMVVAATGEHTTSHTQIGPAIAPSDNNNMEQLPILFSAPKLLLSEAEEVCGVYLSHYYYLFMGYGDVAFPGLFIVKCLHYDINNRHSSTCIYFVVSLIGYIIGLILTFTALTILCSPQPALFYIVPCIILPVLLTASVKGEIRSLVMWSLPAPSDASVVHSTIKKVAFTHEYANDENRKEEEPC